MQIALENFDLSGVHTALTLLGAALAIYVMALTGYEHEDEHDPVWLQWARRLVLVAMAWSCLWSLSFSESRNWQPWPPDLMMLMAMIGYLGVRASAIHARIWREGHRRPSRKT